MANGTSHLFVDADVNPWRDVERSMMAQTILSHGNTHGFADGAGSDDNRHHNRGSEFNKIKTLLSLFETIVPRTMALSDMTGIVDYCASLKTFPHQGIRRDDRRPGLRIANCKGNAVIAFAVDETATTVSNIGFYEGGQADAADRGAAATHPAKVTEMQGADLDPYSKKIGRISGLSLCFNAVKWGG